MDLDIGAVLSQTFGQVKRRFGPLLGLWVVYFAIQMGVSIVMVGALGSTIALGAGAMQDPMAMGFGFILVMIVFYVFYILISMAQSASLTHQASALHTPSFGTSFSAGFKCALTLLGLTLIFIVAYLLAAIVLGIIGAAMSFAGDIGGVLFAIIVMVLAIYGLLPTQPRHPDHCGGGAAQSDYGHRPFVEADRRQRAADTCRLAGLCCAAGGDVLCDFCRVRWFDRGLGGRRDQIRMRLPGCSE